MARQKDEVAGTHGRDVVGDRRRGFGYLQPQLSQPLLDSRHVPLLSTGMHSTSRQQPLTLPHCEAARRREDRQR
jgi:hypothetical protein